LWKKENKIEKLCLPKEREGEKKKSEGERQEEEPERGRGEKEKEYEQRRSCISANNNKKKIKTEEGSELEREWEKNTCCPFSLNSIFSVWFFLQRKEWVHVFKGKDVGF